MMGCFVFIESNTTGTGRLMAAAAVRRGFRTVMLAKDAGRYSFLRGDPIEIIMVDTHDHGALLAACREVGCDTIVGVTSSSDYFVGAGARVAVALGRPSPSVDAIALCSDKLSQRDLLRAAAVPCPPYEHVRSVEQAQAVALAMGGSVVLKPRGGSGSMGVRLCRDGREVRQHAETLLAIRANERGIPIPDGLLIEGFVEGPEYSVEVFSGQVVGVTRKHLGPLPHFVEVGHDFPAPEPSERVARLAATARAAVMALGLTHGPAHVELRDAGREPVLIEVNARLAGGLIPQLVWLATGVDLVDACVCFAAGLPVDLEIRRQAHASIRFLLPPRAGTLRAVTGLEQARAHPMITDATTYRAAGDTVTRGGDFRDRVGHIVACGADAQAVAEAADTATARVGLMVDDGAPALGGACRG